MHRIYKSGQLQYFLKNANRGYWEGHWKKSELKDELRKENRFLIKSLFRYNTIGDKILEAGCGSCAFLYPMHHCGRRVTGIDFACDTLKSIKDLAPELVLCAGDLTDLPFKDDSFDAYWSIGVIEHFQRGYDDILLESKRVLKARGIAYISFPYMNFIRKFKGACGLYDKNIPVDAEFYQYALDHKAVRRKWENHGFKLLDQQYMFPHKRFDSQNNRIIRFLLAPWHHHSIMLILRKTGQ
ncbi:MAG: class I SAM-dependent methyltransferase [Thermodesulfobacteriota bacterium]|nr:class I SAM-dependent methyltransferase [Thermodesulfobacteriota bacterium]